MKLLEQFKDIFPDASYNEENDTIEVFYPDGTHMVTLFGAKDMIEECFDRYEVLDGDFTNPDSDYIYLSGYDAVKHLGGYSEAFRAI